MNMDEILKVTVREELTRFFDDALISAINNAMRESTSAAIVKLSVSVAQGMKDLAVAVMQCTKDSVAAGTQGHKELHVTVSQGMKELAIAMAQSNRELAASFDSTVNSKMTKFLQSVDVCTDRIDEIVIRMREFEKETYARLGKKLPVPDGMTSEESAKVVLPALSRRIKESLRLTVQLPGQETALKVHRNAIAGGPRGRPNEETRLQMQRELIAACSEHLFSFSDALRCSNFRCWRSETLWRVAKADMALRNPPVHGLCIACGCDQAAHLERAIDPQKDFWIDLAALIDADGPELNLLYCVKKLCLLAEKWEASGQKRLPPKIYDETVVIANLPKESRGRPRKPVTPIRIVDDEELAAEREVAAAPVAPPAIPPADAPCFSAELNRARALAPVNPHLMTAVEREAWEEALKERDIDIDRVERYRVARVDAEMYADAEEHAYARVSILIDAGLQAGFDADERALAVEILAARRDLATEESALEPAEAHVAPDDSMWGEPAPASAPAPSPTPVALAAAPSAAPKPAPMPEYKIIREIPANMPDLCDDVPTQPQPQPQPKAARKAKAAPTGLATSVVPEYPVRGAGTVDEAANEAPDDFLWKPAPLAEVDTTDPSYRPDAAECDMRRVLHDTSDADLSHQYEAVKKKPWAGEFNRARIIGDLARVYAGRRD